MSDPGRDFSKATIVTLVPTGLGFLVSGPIAGVVCLFVAGTLSLILWTPLGAWLGFSSGEDELTHREPLSPSDQVRGRMSPEAAVDPRPASDGRIYGSGAITAAILRQGEQEEEVGIFQAVEAEIALAYEEATELHRLLSGEWPYITPTGQDLERAIPDWRLKTTEFIAAVLGSARRAAFKTAAAGKNDLLDQLEAESKFLGALAMGLTPDSIRANQGDVLEARAKRREHMAATFIELEHYRAPGAPPKAAPDRGADGTHEFGRRDDQGDLAQRCHMLSGSVERWVESFNRGHTERAERMVQEWMEADPATDEAEARRRAYTRDEKNWEADYRLKYEIEAKKLFDEAHEMGEIAKEHERLAIAPLAIEFEAVPRLFNEIAARLYGEAA